MAHYAKIENDTVVEIIVAEADFISTLEGEWIQTSYNTIGNKHINGGEPLRGNYASIGCVYDRQNDVFYSQKPFNSWSLNTDTWTWEPPVEKPDNLIPMRWDEELLMWVD